jgi:diguanylate cyclase (GGDEF)-like protein
VLALVVIALTATLSVRPLLSGRDNLRRVQGDDQALQQLLDLRASFADLQIFMEPQIAKFSTTAIAVDPAAIATGSQIARDVATNTAIVTDVLQKRGLTVDASAVATESAAFTASLTAIGTLVTGQPLAVIASTVATERAAFNAATVVTATVATHLRVSSDRYATRSLQSLDSGRKTVIVADAIAALLVLGACAWFGQRLHRRECTSRVNRKRRRYEATLQQALDMAKTEPDAYGIMAKALEQAVPHLDVEMLVADSSGAHFHQTLSTAHVAETEPPCGCGVVSPVDCPATARGHTLVFPSSQALNACPHLAGRPSGDLSAACVAISITGRSSGVVHAMGPDGQPPTDDDITYLEVTTRRASERIAMLRAFEKSETQAHTDPLTGLWNRRSFENRVHELQLEGTPYTIAYGDLDHFKILNDTHGHEAGDQALRLFARVLRDSVRPNDITARYGGEEFVIVFPDCPTDSAVKILERLRERLALTVSSGRVPAFTASFGLSSSTDADTLDEVVAIADQALIAAKASGRNRTVLATDVPSSPIEIVVDPASA